MANSDFGICRRCHCELSVGTSAGAALCWLGTLQCCNFLALFCREPGRWAYGNDNFCGGLDHTSSMGLVWSPACFWLYHNANRGIDSGCIGRIGSGAHLWAMGVYGKNADCAGNCYWFCPYRTNASSSATDISNSGCIRNKERILIASFVVSEGVQNQAGENQVGVKGAMIGFRLKKCKH
jgi:hypothetical protein